MPIRVLGWGLGHVGSYVIKDVLANPDLELAGAVVYTPAKAGRDLGELVGIPGTGLLAMPPADVVPGLADCVIHTPGMIGSELNPEQAVTEICTLLSQGYDVASTALTSLAHPRLAPDDVRKRIEDACRQGEATFHSTGINPGFVFEVLSGLVSSITGQIRRINVTEVYNYEGKKDTTIVRFGQPPRPTETYRGGTRRHIEFNTHAGLGALADMLGVEIDEFTEVREEIAAVEGFDTLAGRIEAGTKAGHRRVVTAIVKGQPFLTAEFVGRAARHVAPEWAGHDLDSSGHRWTVEIDAVPNVTVSMDVTLDTEDPAAPIANVPGSAAIAARVVNAVAAVHAAPPGYLSSADLGFFTGRVGKAG